MPIFLALQNTYTDLEIALFNNTHLLSCICVDKFNASGLLIPTIDTLLKQQGYPLHNLDFMAINQGPGPFTTLRVLITTANGIAYASGIPLVGIDGITALSQEHQERQPQNITTVALLNAFNREVYYASSALSMRGYGTIEEILNIVQTATTNNLQFVGNAVAMYQADIIRIVGTRAHIPSPLPMTCSIEHIARSGLEQWNRKHISQQIEPLYLKTFKLASSTLSPLTE